MALILQYPLGCPRSQIVEDVAHGFERPQVLVGNRNAELVLKRHVQLYRIQAGAALADCDLTAAAYLPCETSNRL